MILKNRQRRSRYLRRGEVVEVRSESEIRAVLDVEGKLEGLPFMPEMAKHCGRRYRVLGRVEKVYLDGRGYVAQMKDTVLLEGARCDGTAHGGCQAGCFALWKEDWLRPASGAIGPPIKDDLPRVQPAASIGDEGAFSCQATELVDAARRISRWQLWRYVRDYTSGDRNLSELSRMVLLTVVNKVRRRLGWHLYGKICGDRTKTPNVRLNLQPGERVRVKSRQEIEATVDRIGRNRGMVFTPDMVRFCGGTYRVARRVERSVIEWTGEMAHFGNTVALEGVTCSGIAVGCCGRRCYHLWREAWLERVDVADEPQVSIASASVASRTCTENVETSST